MRRRLILGACALAALSILACGRGLSHDEAGRVIQQNNLIRPGDNVTVDAISLTNPAEAVVRATVAGNTMNLKFRRFDKGWTWEFVETKAGGWISPDAAMAQIREEQRAAAAARWVVKNRTEYADTAQTMYFITMYTVLNPTARTKLKLWEQLNQSTIKSLRSEPDRTAHQERILAVLTSDGNADAWGNLIEQGWAPENSEAWLLRSFGADRQRATEDDLLCLSTFRAGWENRQVWYQDRSWTMPEGLGSILEEFSKNRGSAKWSIEYTKLPNP